MSNAQFRHNRTAKVKLKKQIYRHSNIMTIIMTAHVSMLLKSLASPDILPFILCNKKTLAIRHMNRLLFPMTLLIPSYDMDKVCRANDLSAPHRIIVKA